MAVLYNKMGKCNEALELFEEVNNLSENVMGKEHPLTISTKKSIAKVLYAQGKYTEAIEILEDILNTKYHQKDGV